MVIVTLAGGPVFARGLALWNGRSERTFASPIAQRRRDSGQRRAGIEMLDHMLPGAI